MIGIELNKKKKITICPQLSPDVRKADMGFVVAAQPLGTVVASPLMGLWANCAGSIRFVFARIYHFLINCNGMVSQLRRIHQVCFLKNLSFFDQLE